MSSVLSSSQPPNTLTYGDSLKLNVSLLSALEQCNLDKATIKSIDANK
ncbi:Rz1-like lysis system protein LysC [Citrobacter freundii]|nr:Rz1 lytic protein [Citrobacter freundii]